jgi:hypothetical protein
MFSKSLCALLLVVAALVGCSKPTDTIIPSDASKWDTELAPSINKLSDEDKKLVMGYVMRAKMGAVFGKEGMPLGTTIGTAIAEQKKWLAAEAVKDAEAKALKEKMLQELATAQAAIDNAVTVTLISKTQVPKDYAAGRYSEQQKFTIGVKNKTDKGIAGVSGELKFIDIFDKEVGAVTFGISEKIAPGGEAKWTGSRDYNQFMAEHKAVWNLEEGKYTTKFLPESIVFADGTKMTVPK